MTTSTGMRAFAADAFRAEQARYKNTKSTTRIHKLRAETMQSLEIQTLGTIAEQGKDVNAWLNLNVEKNRIASQVENNKNYNKARVDHQAKALEDLYELNTRIKQVAHKYNDGSKPKMLKEEVEGFLGDLRNLLNTTAPNGDYIFGGGKSEAPPVDEMILTYTNQDGGGGFDDNYYQGGTEIKKIQIDKSKTLTVGVLANHDAFARTFAAIHEMVRVAEDSTKLDNPVRVKPKAFTGVIEMLDESAQEILSMKATTTSSATEIKNRIASDEAILGQFEDQIQQHGIIPDEVRLLDLAHEIQLILATDEMRRDMFHAFEEQSRSWARSLGIA
jgi:hypothetical protein